ncbi:DUF5693 family protein [Paenibacillus tarimensis]
MLQSLQQWNRRAGKWLWALTVIGIIAAMPLGVMRYQMEKTSEYVEFVFDYRDLLQVATYQAKPLDFLDAQLEEMKAAGIGTMAVFESTLDELNWAGRITLYNSAQAAALRGEPAPVNENYTYVLFTEDSFREGLGEMIVQTFTRAEIPVRPWTYAGRTGLVIETPVEDASVKTMPPDPIAMKELHDRGFQLLPRLSDRIRPFDAELTETMLANFKALGIKRILFDGAAVTGYADHAEDKSLRTFGELLKEYGIGVSAIENLKTPQKGMNTLAYVTDYNVARLYSLSENDSMQMSPDAIADRFLLAAKDRNIRMFYLNSQPLRSLDKGGIVHSLGNVYEAIRGSDDAEGAAKLLEEYGFKIGSAVPFETNHAPWMKAVKALVALGAVAIIALLIGVFAPALLLPSFVAGVIGSAGLYAVSSSILEQALALGASISAPTLALVWAIRRVQLHTEGDRRSVGGQWNAMQQSEPSRSGVGMFGGQWVFTGLPAGRRLTMALGLYICTAVMSLAGVPFIFGLLNDITYSLVIQQFRGVSLLHLAPIALVTLYLFLYTGTSIVDNIKKLLKLQITVLWVVAAGVIGVVGMYYMSRTGNAGTALNVELLFRNLLESTFGVRPRLKEFMFSHPLFLVGLFLALRYRAAWALFVIASIGQLSMVDTFAHIHTPIILSVIRVLLGLGLGAVIGLVLIGLWQVLEGVWRRWGTKLKTALSE